MLSKLQTLLLGIVKKHPATRPAYATAALSQLF